MAVGENAEVVRRHRLGRHRGAERAVHRFRKSFSGRWATCCFLASPATPSYKDKIRDTVSKELPDAIDKLSKAENKLSDAKKKLLDAKKELSDAENRLLEAEDKLADAARRVTDRDALLNPLTEAVNRCSQKVLDFDASLKPLAQRVVDLDASLRQLKTSELIALTTAKWRAAPTRCLTFHHACGMLGRTKLLERATQFVQSAVKSDIKETSKPLSVIAAPRQ
jgi:hypothetical protein